MPIPTDPTKYDEWRKKISDSLKKFFEDPKNRERSSKTLKIYIIKHPEFKEKTKNTLKKYWDNPENCKKQSILMKNVQGTEDNRKKNSERVKKYFEDPITRLKHKELMQKVHQTPEARKKICESLKKRWEKPEEHLKQSDVQKKRFEDPQNCKNHKEAMQKVHQTPEARKKNSERVKKYFENPEARKKNSERVKKYFENPENRKRLSKIQKQRYLDHVWYGNVVYPEKKIYCELWNEDLRERIRAYWNRKSVLSGKTKEKNKNHSLSCHHVYYQEKACCIWDEDTQGYYVTLNTGTTKNPIILKYYIKGDPNKFVTLTSQEHGSTKKDKLKWIKLFEDIIENQGGKCYLTKDEWNQLSNNQCI